MPKYRHLNPSILSLLALLVILAGSVATSNGATSSLKPLELTTADGIVQSPGSSQGYAGPQGATGPRGKRGPRGKTGARGRTGARGPIGASGAMGQTGAAGPPGLNGATGVTGAAGVPGVAGATGATGPIGPSDFAQFYALMPTDNSSTVAPGAPVEFPQDGPSDGAISRLGATLFNLTDIGTYRVSFSVPADEPGQLVLSLNGAELGYTVVGRATGTSPIAGEALVTTTVANSLISVLNPSGNIIALTISPSAGGNAPVSASLIIERIR